MTPSAPTFKTKEKKGQEQNINKEFILKHEYHKRIRGFVFNDLIKSYDVGV